MSDQYLLQRIEQLEKENEKLRERNLELEKKVSAIEALAELMQKSMPQR